MASTPPDRPKGFPIYRNFMESLDGQMIGYAENEREAVKVAVRVGVTGLKHGGKPRLLEYIGGSLWLLED